MSEKKYVVALPKELVDGIVNYLCETNPAAAIVQSIQASAQIFEQKEEEPKADE